MRIASMILSAAIAIFLASIAPGGAQQKSELNFRNGTINLDRQKFKKEFDQHERDAVNPSRAARSLRPNNFCIVCDDGTKINCKSFLAGEPGRLLCGMKGIVLCSNSTGRVDFGKC